VGAGCLLLLYLFLILWGTHIAMNRKDKLWGTIRIPWGSWRLFSGKRSRSTFGMTTRDCCGGGRFLLVLFKLWRVVDSLDHGGMGSLMNISMRPIMLPGNPCAFVFLANVLRVC